MKTDLITSNRFPEFFREEFPDLIKFVEEYYRFIEEDTFNGKLNYATDLDLAASLDDKYLSVFLEHYRNQFAVDVPTFENIATIEFLRNAAEVYSHKGTEKCLKFLFRIAFGEEIEVAYPKYNMLRASESTWTQEFHIRLQRVYKITDDFIIEPYDKLSWVNDRGNFQINIKNVENVSDSDSLIFFDSNQQFYIDTLSESNLQKFLIRRNGIKVYEGIIKKTFSHFEVQKGGKFWQKGQVFQIPGQKKSTIARVFNSQNEGTIKTVEVKEYGYELLENSWYTIHPFQKPPTANINITSEIDSFNFTTGVITRHHRIDILDDTEGLTETIDGGSWIQTYMLSGDYFQHQAPETAPYYGSLAFIQTVNQTKPTRFTDFSSYTIEQWKESETVLISKFDYVVKNKGRFQDWTGLISDSQSVIQDSFYYQTYSYTIETQKQFKEAEQIIKFNHPAGTKSFIQQKRTNDLGYAITGSRSISQDYIVLFDATTIYDFTSKFVEKVVQDQFTTQDTLSKNIGKSGIVDYVAFGGWDAALSYGEVAGDPSTWYNINNDYNYPSSSVSLTSFFESINQFFDGGFFTKQMEIVE